MTILGFTSVHGSPGATSLAIAVAHHLSARSAKGVLLLEADPDGGTIAVRLGVPGGAGLTALAGAARSGITADDLVKFAVRLPSGVPVIAAHPAAEQAHAALRVAANHIAPALRVLVERGEHVVIDLGRLRPGSPGQPLAAVCDRMVIVARPVADQLVAIGERLPTLGEIAPVGIALIGDRPYGPDEVRRTLGVDLVAVIANDASAVGADPAGAATGRRAYWARSVAGLVDLVADPTDGSPEVVAEGPIEQSAPEPVR